MTIKELQEIIDDEGLDITLPEKITVREAERLIKAKRKAAADWRQNHGPLIIIKDDSNLWH